MKSLAGVGVAIVNYRTARLASEMLRRWSDQRVAESRVVSVVLVDNDVGALDGLAGLDLPLVYLRSERNTGYAAAVNRACRQMDTPYVLLLNPDARIEFDAVGLMARVLDEQPRVGAVAPLHIDRAGRVTNPYRTIPSWLDLAAHKTRLQRFAWAKERVQSYLCADLDELDGEAAAVAVEQPPASCLLLRRSAITGDVMDERFPILFNDVDLSRRLATAGWATLIEPRARCLHEPATSTRYLGAQAAAEYYVGAYRYVCKWEGGMRGQAYRACVIAELTARAVSRGPVNRESRRALQALMRNHSIFDSAQCIDPVRRYWPED